MSANRYYVYILASKSRALYVGMTGLLMSRMLQRKTGDGGEFLSKYRVYRLVYYEMFEHAESAIRRETEVKKWRREKKISLVEKKNPKWEDLAAERGEPGEMTFKPLRLNET